MADERADLRAPWTPEQVAALNRFQREGGMHPFTCGGDHESHHVLVATPDGWVCPDRPVCGYTQDWAHWFMARPDTWPLARFALRVPREKEERTPDDS